MPVVLDDGARKYVWGLGLAYAVDTAGNPAVYHTDGLGSVRAITDASGAIVETYQSDEFGVPTQSQGSVNQPFQYTGEQRDAESSLVYLRARMYDPSIGRFLQRDALAGSSALPQSLNRYSYAQNNPTTLTDPSGNCAIIGCIAIAWAIFEVGSSVVDAVTTAQTFLDPDASLKDKALSVGGLAIGFVAPGGGYGTGAKAVVKGGVYRLVDSAGATRYVGRAANLAKRRIDHHLDAVKGAFQFDILQKTDDYATQRGLEQVYYDLLHPDLNEVRPISLRNDKIDEYLGAAQDFLSGLLGGG